MTAAELVLLTPSEVAARLGVTGQTLKNWRRTDRGPAWTQIGGVIRYPKAALENWIRSNTTKAAS